MYSHSGLQARQDSKVINTWQQWLLFAILLGVVSLAPKTTPGTQILLDKDSVLVGLSLQSPNATLLSPNTLSRSLERPVCKLDRLHDPNWSLGDAVADTLCLPGIVASISLLAIEDFAFPGSIVVQPYAPRAPPVPSLNLI